MRNIILGRKNNNFIFSYHEDLKYIVTENVVHFLVIIFLKLTTLYEGGLTSQ